MVAKLTSCSEVLINVMSPNSPHVFLTEYRLTYPCIKMKLYFQFKKKKS